jgi:hypothetical protein
MSCKPEAQDTYLLHWGASRPTTVSRNQTANWELELPAEAAQAKIARSFATHARDAEEAAPASDRSWSSDSAGRGLRLLGRTALHACMHEG